MAKKARVYDGTAWQELASAQTDLTAYSTTSQISSTYSPISTTGLVLLNSTSFTSATSVSVDNVFSSTYDNYEIHINATSNSGGFVPTIRYRTGGTTATTNYQWTRTYFLGSATATSQGNAQASSQIARLDSAGGYVVVQLSNVNLATPTFGFSRSYDNTGDHDIFGIYHSTATAYDGFNLTLGTTTGNVRTYGIRK